MITGPFLPSPCDKMVSHGLTQNVYLKMFKFHMTGSAPLIPYGLPCVRELFRFLISLTNPLDRHNTDVMIHMGLSLLTVALESGADHIGQFNSLIYLVKDDMCRHLFLVRFSQVFLDQGSHRLEKYLNLEGFLEN